MRYDTLREPISEDDPCGPDLDETGDNDYGNYMLLASGRLPSKFYSVRDDGVEAPFDKASIDLDDELEAIDGFLKRSRDIRLLTLEARFQILTGSLKGFCEAVQGLAIVTTEFWAKFLPLPYEGDHMLRQNTVEGLDDPVQILLPLQYAPLIVGGGSLPTVTYRNYMVASGKAKIRAGEEALKLAELDATLAAPTTGEKAKETHETILATVEALNQVRETFIKNAGHEFAPNYDRLNALLAAMDELIVSHRPELAPAKPAEEAEEGEPGADGQPTAAPLPVNMPNHEAARAALIAASQYFRRMEPSSPAFILVHQSAKLIGRPLVEALAALMPTASAKAMLRMSGGYDFDIDLTRMKAITEDGLAAPLPDLPPLEPPPPPPAPVAPPPPPVVAAPVEAPAATDGAGPEAAAADGAPLPDGAPPPAPAPAPAEAPAAAAPPPPPPAPRPPAVPEAPKVFVARTRVEATGLMLGVEAFFRVVEPSSPIPLLLAKARGLLNRDFPSIMNEIAPREPGK